MPVTGRWPRRTAGMGLEQQGRALNDLRRYEEALAAYDRALALDPNTPGLGNKGTRLTTWGATRRHWPPTITRWPSTRMSPTPGTTRASRSRPQALRRRRWSPLTGRWPLTRYDWSRLARQGQLSCARWGAPPRRRRRRNGPKSWAGRGRRLATALSPSPSPKREGSQRQSQQWRQMATLVALTLPSQGRVAEGRERSRPPPPAPHVAFIPPPLLILPVLVARSGSGSPLLVGEGLGVRFCPYIPMTPISSRTASADFCSAARSPSVSSSWMTSSTPCAPSFAGTPTKRPAMPYSPSR